MIKALSPGTVKLRLVESSIVGSCLDEVVVEKAVEDGVGAGGGDAQHVAEEEGDHHRLCRTRIFSSIIYIIQ